MGLRSPKHIVTLAGKGELLFHSLVVGEKPSADVISYHQSIVWRMFCFEGEVFRNDHFIFVYRMDPKFLRNQRFAVKNNKAAKSD